MGCGFDESLKGVILDSRITVHSGKEVHFRNFELCCTANVFLGQRHRRASGLDVLGRGRSWNGEAKVGWIRVEGKGRG